MGSTYSDEDLKVIGRLYVEAVANERGQDPAELVKTISVCVRAVESPAPRELNEALLDAVRAYKDKRRDHPELLIQDLVAFLRATQRPDEDIEHFAERARKLGYRVA